MAYDKRKLYQQAVDAIEKHNLFFIEDIVAFIPCSKPTFYSYFTVDSDEFNAIRELLEINIIKTKSSIRGKLYKNGNFADLAFLYRQLCSNDERKNVSTTYQETKHSGEVKTTPNIVVQTEEARKELEGLINDIADE